MIAKLASAVFTAIIFVIVGFLWINSSDNFKSEVARSAELALEKFNGLFKQHPPSEQSSNSQNAVSANSAKTKSQSSSKTGAMPIPEFNIPLPKSPTKIASKTPGVATTTNPATASTAAKSAKPKSVKRGAPIQFVKKTVDHVPLYETIINLQDPECFIAVGLANNAEMANDAHETHGDESFETLVKRAHASVVMNGTFFSKDDQKRVMGNMVSGGRFLKYSPWENFGTTFGLMKNNEPNMVTARADGKPRWDNCWFSLTCGPRLLRDGIEWIHPDLEGFSDSHVLGIGPRCAMGFTADKSKLILCTFVNGLSLPQEARLMKELGCSDAMNLDGGASRALAYNGTIVMPAQRPLTNVLIVYDTRNRAPQQLISSWKSFQEGNYPVATHY